MRRAWPTIKRLLWIAATPLALSVVLANAPAVAQVHGSDAPPAAAQSDHGGEAHGGEAHHAGGPIKNWFDFTGYRSKNAQGRKLEPGDEKMPAPFGGALLNFAVFAFILYKLFGKSFTAMVLSRHETIAKQLAESGRLRDEAAQRLAEYTKRVQNLDAEIGGLVAGIRSEAETDRARIIAEAESRAARLRKDAELQIQAEIARVRATLEREAVETAMTMARKILTEKATDADQRALAEKFIKELGAAPRPRA
jgi:F-type H+-transporting ATPase subunit b